MTRLLVVRLGALGDIVHALPAFAACRRTWPEARIDWLVESRHQTRFIYYSANFEVMNALVGYLGENCCGGRSCVPAGVPLRKRKSS